MSLPAELYETPLSGEEDANLGRTAYQKTQGTVNAKTWQHPPGISNLKEWGEERLLTGKMSGRSFKQIYEDHPDYVNQLRNRSKLSPIFQSFQNYIHARAKFEAKMIHHRVPMPMAKSTPEKIKTENKISSSKPKTSGSWEIVEGPTDHKTTPKKEKGDNIQNKRSSQVLQQSQAMSSETNPEQVQQLQTQIAILQRELARVTHVPEDA